MPWQNMVLIQGVGTINRAIGIVVFGIVLFATLYNKRFRFHLLHGSMFLFGVWVALSYLWSIDTELTEIAIESYIQYFILAWFIYQWATDKNKIDYLFIAYILGCCVAIGGTLFSYASNIYVSYHRYAATGFDENYLAVIISLGIPMSWYLSLHAHSVLKKALYRIFPAMAFIAILLTASRGGFLVMLISFMFIVLSFTELKRKEKAVVFISLIGLLIVILPFIPVESIERIETIDDELSKGSLNSRIQIWKAGLESIGDISFSGIGILWGNGIGTFRTVVAPYLGGIPFAAHNAYLSILVETGVIGLLLYVQIFALALYSAYKMPKRERMLWIILLLQWGAAAMTLSLVLHKVTWLLLGLLAANTQTLEAEGGQKSL